MPVLSVLYMLFNNYVYLYTISKSIQIMMQKKAYATVNTENIKPKIV